MTDATPAPAVSFSTDVPAAPLAALILKNLALTILTLGVYRFWGKTHIRRFLWNHTLIQGERLDYTGTGGELFKGFLLVLVTVFLPLLLINAAAQALVEQENLAAAGALFFVFTAAAMYLPGVAIFRAARYRLSRTRWRGVRFGLEGKGWSYGLWVMLFLLILVATMGLSYPVQRVGLWRRLWDQARFGNKAFHFDGGVRNLYPRFLLVWTVFALGVTLAVGIPGLIAAQYAPVAEPPGGIPAAEQMAYLALTMTFPLFMLVMLPVWLSYKALELRTLAEGLGFEGVRFSFDVRFWPLLRLLFGNMLLVMLTLGLGGPFAAARSLRFVCDRLHPVGEVDFAAIAQGAAPAPASGEGLAEMFDSVDI
ncbi:MAG: DUF898 domain-containing protein [Alphaproteobacteria bacterium]|nr:DUF898 domain-containing protein [Alphaproteobacteria bacterium]